MIFVKVGDRFSAIRNTLSQENGTIDDYSMNLGMAILVSASRDLTRCMKKDIRKNEFSVCSYKDKSTISTANVVYFFSSSLCELICGNIDPWYIVQRLADDINYPFMEELQENYERGKR